MTSSLRSSALALTLVLGGCSLFEKKVSAPPPPAAEVSLFITADLHGYIEPCGCSENMRGGLSRSAQVLAEARTGNREVLFFDSGDALFPAASIPDEAVGQQERKAKTIAQGFSLMQLSARVPGPLDDARGAAFHAAFGLPEVALGTVKAFDVKGHRVSLVAAESMSAAEALAKVAKAEGAVFVVAIVPVSFDVGLKGLLEAKAVDLVVASKPRDELSAEENRMLGTISHLAQVQNKGRSLLRVDLVLRDRGPVNWLRGSGEHERELATLDERIELTRAQVDDPSLSAEMKALRQQKLDDLIGRRAALADEVLPVPATGNVANFRFIPIEASLKKNDAVAELERAYNHDVGELNLAWASEHGRSCEPATPQAPGFIGTALCGACHPAALETWKHTKHPHAYEALEKEGKQYHLDCVGCHLAGWQKPQGVCRIDQTTDRREVACESCHGPGSTHLTNPIKDNMPRVDRTTCITCHDRDNSPHFDFDVYWPKIRGPGHGQLPDGGIGSVRDLVRDGG